MSPADLDFHPQAEPERWPVYLDATRYYPLRKFPYLVVYRYSNGVAYILSVAHTKRREGFWRRRLKH